MKVLVVEDERRIAASIKKGLMLGAVVVDVTHDGGSGYDMASANRYDVIVLDRMLPGMDGIAVCKTLRKDGNKTPILLLTAKDQVADRVEGLEAGADDYLGKPFAFSELVARINALARRPTNHIQTTLQEGSLTLDTNTYSVTRGGVRIELSKKEYALLEFLMRHKGQVFNAEQLTEHVWDYDSDVLPNTAQVYIGYLRNKIDRPFVKEKPLIKTVRGFGYSFG